ncbi:MAG: hypothetical protein M3Q07_26540 [Pseudobdellovibrionaceae bacterium]|nr:hypothetical protein [Pseudobdellovibrionaceae bacterium]
MKKFMFLASMFLTATIYAGGIGGSNPPALESLEEVLMARAETVSAGLFTTELGSVGLGVKGPLAKEILLSKASLRPQSLMISESDFNALNTSRFGKTIDAVSLDKVPLPTEQQARSYQINDGDSPEELILKDRREIMRSAVK